MDATVVIEQLIQKILPAGNCIGGIFYSRLSGHLPGFFQGKEPNRINCFCNIIINAAIQFALLRCVTCQKISWQAGLEL
jgi:hypothetical protein